MKMIDKMRKKQGLATPPPVAKEPPVVKAQPAPEVPKAKKDPKWGRLPDGAEFHLKYDADAVKWSGVLAISGYEIPGSARALFTLLTYLDRSYRRNVAKAAADETKKDLPES